MRLQLLTTTALSGLMVFAGITSAFANCDDNAPANSATVTCAAGGGTDNAGVIAPGSTGVTVNVTGGGIDSNAGAQAIELGDNATVSITGGNVGASGFPVTSITFGGNGTITVGAAGSVSANSSSENAFMYGGASGTDIVNFHLNGAITSGNVDFGTSQGNFYLGSTGNYGSSIINGGGGGADTVHLDGGTGTFDTDDITTQFLNFETFRVDSGAWTLTGTVKQDWVIGGGALTGTLANLADVDTSGGTLTIAQNTNIAQGGGDVISGTGNVVKTGTGNATLAGTNTYSGTTTITGGTLTANSADSLGDNSVTNTIILNGGTLAYGNAFAEDRATALAASSTLDSAANAITYNGLISGTGDLTLQGSGGGSFTLANTGNTFTGDVILDSGTLNLSDFAALGNAANKLVLDGGTLNMGATQTTAHDFDIDSSSTINTGANNLTLTGDINETAGTLTKSGTGTLDVSGASSATWGGTGITVSAGTLTGTTGTINTDITDNAAVIINQASNGTHTGNISGTGTFTKQGAGNVTLSGTNTYTGGTTVTAGTLTGTTSSLQGNIVDNAAVVINQAGSGTQSGDISGTGTFTKQGAGNVTLSGNNTYTGGTTVTAGTLTGTTTSLQGNVVNNAAVVIDQAVSGTQSGDISGTGTFTKQGAGNVTLSGTNTYSGGTTVSAGTLTGTTTSLQGNITNNAAVVINQAGSGTQTSNITGTGTLTKQGAGNVTLSGTNTYSGGTTVSAGTLTGTTTSLQGNVTNNAELVYNQAGSGTTSTATSGTGNVTYQGGGTYTLGTASTYSGTTTINNATVNVDAANKLGDESATNDIVLSGTLSATDDFTTTRDIQVDNPSTISVASGKTMTLNGALSDNSALNKTGTGRLNVTAAGTYSGAVNVNGGRLSVNASLANADVNVNSGGTLGGTGTVNDVAVASGGTFAPGNSIGTTNVTGNVTFNPGSTYQVELDSTGASDRIAATGTATINGGTVDARAAAGTYPKTTTYTIITASGVTGAFDNATSDTAFLDPTLIYNAANVQLRMDRNDVNFASVAADSQQAGVANAIATDFNVGNDLFDAVLGMSASQAQNAYDQLSGEHMAGIGATIATSAERVRNMVRYRIQARADQAAANNTPAPTPVAYKTAPAAPARNTVAANNVIPAAPAPVPNAAGYTVTPYIPGANNVTASNTPAPQAADFQVASVNPNGYTVTPYVPNTDNSVYVAAMVEPAAGQATKTPSSGTRVSAYAPAALDNQTQGWFEAIGSKASTDADGPSPSQRSNTVGGIMGFDLPVNDGTVGAYAAYETTDLETSAQNASSDISTYRLGVYGSQAARAAFISGGISLAYHDINSARNIAVPGFSATATGDTGALSADTYLELALPMSVGKNTLEPYLNAAYSYSRIDGYDETGAGTANLAVGDTTTQTPSTTLGLRVTGADLGGYDLKLIPRADLGWQHIYGDTHQDTTMRFVTGSTPFDIQASGRDRDTALVGVGLDVGSERVKGYADYNGRFGATTEDHAVRGGVKYKLD